MFQYDQLEDEVVTRLAALSDVAVIAPLPESTKLINKVVADSLNEDKIAMLVAYAGSDFDPSKSAGIVNQTENLSILINLQSNRLRGERGIYYGFELVKKNLQGYKLSNGSRLKLKSIDLDDRNEDTSMFSWNVVLTATKEQVQKDPDGDDDTTGLSTLKNVTYDDKY